MRIFKNLKVGTKFITLNTISILTIIFIGIYAYTQLSIMAEETENIYSEKFIPNNWISDAAQTNLRIDSILIEMLFIEDLEKKQALHEEIDQGVEEVFANFATYEAMELTEEEQAQITDFYKAVGDLEGKQDEMIELALVGNNDAAFALFEAEVKEARTNLVKALHNLNDIKENQTELVSNAASETASKTGQNILVAVLIMAVTIIGLGWIFGRTIMVPIRQLLNRIQLAKNGDFTVRTDYQSKDELGTVLDSFNDMLSSMQQALSNVRKSVIEVDDNAANLSANIQESGATTEHVVAAVQEIAAGSDETKKALENNAIILNEITTKVSEIQQELGNIEGIARQSLQAAKAGAATVADNVNQMEKIQQSITDSNRVIDSLSNQVGDVDQILQVINSISEQTNLLALNAAIEAARAGEHGKGFAVVADEVRKLAEQSLQSTKSISGILSSIKQNTEQSVENMAIVLNEANKGLTFTHSSADQFNSIYIGATNVAPLVAHMVTTVEVMNESLTHFVNNADAIFEISVSNAASTEEVSASTEQQLNATMYMQKSAESLADVASDLNAVLQKFKI